MIFHIGYDIPSPKPKQLDEASEDFTSEEVRIIKDQIRKNAVQIDEHIKRIDLFVNHEHCPEREGFIERLRQRLLILMEENDTFRNVLWKQMRQESIGVI